MTNDQIELLIEAALNAGAFSGSMLQAIREAAEHRDIALSSNEIDRLLLAANTRWANLRKGAGALA